MKKDSRLSSVLHAILHMAEQDKPMTSDVLAMCMKTNPVVVRRTMGLLRNAGLVTSERGHSGGWRICADLNKVTLYDLHDALGEPSIFAIGNRHERPDCLVEQAVNAALDDAFADAQALLISRFKTVTLAKLADDFAHRHAKYRQQKE
ncbi:DNA-binding IscR family transcriptional regulator [Yoonia maritima]|uniref:DNA-binding IscR family transcriptional regulator n=1 Tax=Yoonia maritima TaxID=1435347 RepID=A0A2T0W4J3_9RHOB|nr:Rrf2 family transcriptional regulator [Yoonia maritima]PRY80370.1 DNA-binding IscR family transcriptional regulator [Yoonia maritima]